MKIAIFNLHLPRPNQASGDRRLYEILQMLSRDHKVDYYYVAWADEPYDSQYSAMLESINIRLIKLHRVRTAAAWYLLGNRYDLGIFEFYNTAKLFLTLFRIFQPRVPALIDSVDVHYLRIKVQNELGIDTHDLWQKKKADELKTYKRADGVLVVSHEDEAELKKENIGKIFYLPNIVPRRTRLEQNEGKVVLFIGGFNHSPNRDAVEWLVTEIWPQVHTRFPDAELRIIGSKMPDYIRAYAKYPGVKPLGFIKDTTAQLDGAQVSVAPLRFGAGMKGKVNEAMASGIPVVSTSFGIQGIPGESGTHFLVTDSATEFSEYIIKLLDSSKLRELIGKNGQDLSENVCGYKVARDCLEKIFRQIGEYGK